MRLGYHPSLSKINGGAMRDRTADLLNANQALSQLSYSPVKCTRSNHDTCQVNQIVANRGVKSRRIACYASGFTTKSSGDLVGLGRFELPTSPLSGVRSNQLSYRPILTCLCLPWTALFCSFSRSCAISTLPPSLTKRLARTTTSCAKPSSKAAAAHDYFRINRKRRRQMCEHLKK